MASVCTRSPRNQENFLVQLSWSDLLSDQALSKLLENYENELRLHWLMQMEKHKRALHTPNRSVRETILWEMISQNIVSTYQNEINWVRETRHKLFESQEIKEKEAMTYQIQEIENKKYIELISIKEPLNTENDALNLIALCWEHEINVLMLHPSTLSDDFYKLKTKVAGNIIQKFTNYGMKAAAIMPDETNHNERFKEMAMETNKGNHFRMYSCKEDAVAWLLK